MRTRHTVHPDATKVLEYFHTTNSEMKKNIDRTFKFKPGLTGKGLIAEVATYEIVGLQKNYRGEDCYRAMYLPVIIEGEKFIDNWGCCAHPDDIQFALTLIKGGVK
jgi:hypothetical protein